MKKESETEEKNEKKPEEEGEEDFTVPGLKLVNGKIKIDKELLFLR